MELSNDFDVSVPVEHGMGGAHRRRAHRAVPARAPSSRRSRATSTAASSRSRSARSPPSTRARPPSSRRTTPTTRPCSTRRAATPGARATPAPPSPPSSSRGGDAHHTSTVTTDLTVTGKVAQFGRGVHGRRERQALGQFVDNLEQTVLDRRRRAPAPRRPSEAEQARAAEARRGRAASTQPTPTARRARRPPRRRPIVDPEAVAAAEVTVEQAVRKIDMPEPEAIDLLEHAGSPVLKRAVPVLGVAVVVFVLWRVAAVAGSDRPRPPSGPGWPSCSVAPPRATSRSWCATPTGDPVVHPQRAVPRRRHARCPPATGSCDPALRAAIGTARVRRAGSARPRPTIDPDAVADRPRRATPPSATRDLPDGHTGPAPVRRGGGTREGVKCLHAHYAWWLAGGDDPVGQWVARPAASSAS